MRKKIVPIGSYVIVTDPLPEALARDAGPRNRMIYDSKNFLYYFRLTPDRGMLFGGRALLGSDRFGLCCGPLALMLGPGAFLVIRIQRQRPGQALPNTSGR